MNVRLGFAQDVPCRNATLARKGSVPSMASEPFRTSIMISNGGVTFRGWYASAAQLALGKSCPNSLSDFEPSVAMLPSIKLVDISVAFALGVQVEGKVPAAYDSNDSVHA